MAIILQINPYQQQNNINEDKDRGDTQVDYGGHIWGGKSIWIRDAFSLETPPYTIQTGEDMMISAILYIYYGIPTISPKTCLNKDIYRMSYGSGDQFASWKQHKNKTAYDSLRNTMADYWINQRNWLLLKYGSTKQEIIDIDKHIDSHC